MKVLIIGAGHVGTHLAKLLSESGNEVIVVDKDPVKCERIANETDVMALNRDATDIFLYEDVDLATIDVAVAVTDKDEVNLFVAAIARDYGVPRIVVRVKDPRVARLLERIGIEHAITEPFLIAKIMESLIEGRYHAVELSPVLTGGYALVSFTVTESDSSVGKRLDEINYPREKAKILAVFDGSSLKDPVEVSELRPGYEIIALIHKETVEEFMSAFR